MHEYSTRQDGNRAKIGHVDASLVALGGSALLEQEVPHLEEWVDELSTGVPHDDCSVIARLRIVSVVSIELKDQYFLIDDDPRVGKNSGQYTEKDSIRKLLAEFTDFFKVSTEHRIVVQHARGVSVLDLIDPAVDDRRLLITCPSDKPL